MGAPPLASPVSLSKQLQSCRALQESEWFVPTKMGLSSPEWPKAPPQTWNLSRVLHCHQRSLKPSSKHMDNCSLQWGIGTLSWRTPGHQLWTKWCLFSLFCLGLRFRSSQQVLATGAPSWWAEWLALGSSSANTNNQRWRALQPRKLSKITSTKLLGQCCQHQLAMLYLQAAERASHGDNLQRIDFCEWCCVSMQVPRYW